MVTKDKAPTNASNKQGWQGDLVLSYLNSDLDVERPELAEHYGLHYDHETIDVNIGEASLNEKRLMASDDGDEVVLKNLEVNWVRTSYKHMVTLLNWLTTLDTSFVSHMEETIAKNLFWMEGTGTT